MTSGRSWYPGRNGKKSVSQCQNLAEDLNGTCVKSCTESRKKSEVMVLTEEVAAM